MKPDLPVNIIEISLRQNGGFMRTDRVVPVVHADLDSKINLLGDIMSHSIKSDSSAAQGTCQNAKINPRKMQSFCIVDSGAQTVKRTYAMVSVGKSSSMERRKQTPHDYIFGKLIGEGSFSSVFLAREIATGRELAIKMCEKEHILKERKQG